MAYRLDAGPDEVITVFGDAYAAAIRIEWHRYYVKMPEPNILKRTPKKIMDAEMKRLEDFQENLDRIVNELNEMEEGEKKSYYSKFRERFMTVELIT